VTQTRYEAVIGLEVHAQLATRTKMFCGCSTAYGAAPHTPIRPFRRGLHRALPVPGPLWATFAAPTCAPVRPQVLMQVLH